MGTEETGVRCLRCPVIRDGAPVPVVLATIPIAAFDRILPTAQSALRGSESDHFGRLTHRRRQESFLMGRWVAKHAVAGWTGSGEVTDIEIARGVFDQPLVRGPGIEGCRVGLSHDGHWAVALAFPDSHPMGIDVETVDPSRMETIASQLSVDERSWMESSPDPVLWATALWTAREALSKAVGCGLTVPSEILAVAEFRGIDPGSWTGVFARFSQYQVRTIAVGGTLLSIVLPRRSDPGNPQEWRVPFNPPGTGPRIR